MNSFRTIPLTESLSRIGGRVKGEDVVKLSAPIDIGAVVKPFTFKPFL